MSRKAISNTGYYIPADEYPYTCPDPACGSEESEKIGAMSDDTYVAIDWRCRKCGLEYRTVHEFVNWELI